MKWKTTLVLVGLVAALLAYYLLLEPKTKTTEEASKDAKRVFSFPETDVRALRIVRPEGTIRLERTENEKWRVTEPVAARADRWSADAAAGAVANLEQERSLVNEKGASGLEEMGLATPRARVEFTLATGTAPMAVEFGSEVPAANSVFLRVQGRDEILLVPASSVSPFLKRVEEYRDRALLDQTILDLGEARIARPEGDLRFRRRDEEWWIEHPFEDLAAGEVVQGLLSNMIGLRAEEFVDDPGAGAQGKPTAERTDLGLDPPRQTIRLFDRAGKELATIRIGATVPLQGDRAFARVETPSGPATTAKVPVGGLESLAKPASEFRARKALPFRTWEVSAVNLTSPTITLSFVKSEGVWSATTPSSLEVEGSAVEETLKLLSELEIAAHDAAKGMPLTSIGLEPQRTQIEISFEGSGSAGARSLVLGARAGADVIYARASGRPGVFTVASSILDRISGGAALYETKGGQANEPPGDSTEDEVAGDGD